MNQTVSDYRFKFSVVTAVYNVEPYLAEAIESILAQDIGFEESVEMVLVDDGSTDNTGNLVKRFQQEADFDIRYYHQENQHKFLTFFRGIDLAKGQYFSPLDSDDALPADSLAILVQTWESISDDMGNFSLYRSFKSFHSKDLWV